MTKQQTEQVIFLLNQGFQIIVKIDKVALEIGLATNNSEPFKKTNAFSIKGNGSLVATLSIPSNGVFLVNSHGRYLRVFDHHGECLIIYGPTFDSSEKTTLLYNESDNPNRLAQLNSIKVGQTVLIKQVLDECLHSYIPWETILGEYKWVVLNSLHFISWCGTKKELDVVLASKDIQTEELRDDTLGEDELVFLVGIGKQELIIQQDGHTEYGIYIVSQL